MSEVVLDGQRPKGALADRLADPATVLRRALVEVRADLLAGGRYLAGLQIDGKPLSGKDLTAKLPLTIGSLGRLELASGKLSEVLLAPFARAEAQFQTSLDDIATTLNLLADGDEAKACEHLASEVGVWPLMAEHVQRLLSALSAVGWPPEDLRGLEAVPAILADHTAHLRDLLSGRDFPAAVLLLSGPVVTAHRKALRALRYLMGRFERPRKRRKAK